jgi:mRNA-degrading endonuclease YafQ of YafQ-DinJ toxin-antitoxin module
MDEISSSKIFFKKNYKKIIYMEKTKEQIKEIVVLFFNNCNPLIVVYNL